MARRWWNLRSAVAYAVFVVQAALAVLFFWNLGAGGIESIIMAATGVCLELTKRHTWSMVHGRERPWALIGLAMVFSLLSGMSAVAYTWSVSEEGLDRAHRLETHWALIQSQIRALDQESEAIRDKLHGLPADWVTLSLRYSARLEAIAGDHQRLQDELGGLGGMGLNEVHTGLYSFKNWAESVGFPWGSVVLGFLVLTSLLLEVGVVLTCAPRPAKPGSGPEDLQQLIMRKAYVAPDKPLVSRRKLAAMLKVSEPEVRKVFGMLTAHKLAGSRPGTKGLFPSPTYLEACSGGLWGPEDPPH